MSLIIEHYLQFLNELNTGVKKALAGELGPEAKKMILSAKKEREQLHKKYLDKMKGFDPDTKKGILDFDRKASNQSQRYRTSALDDLQDRANNSHTKSPYTFSKKVDLEKEPWLDWYNKAKNKAKANVKSELIMGKRKSPGFKKLSQKASSMKRESNTIEGYLDYLN